MRNRLGRPYNRGRVVQKLLHPILNKPATRSPLCFLQTTGAVVAQWELRHADARTTLAINGHGAMDKIESVLQLPSGT